MTLEHPFVFKHVDMDVSEQCFEKMVEEVLGRAQCWESPCLVHHWKLYLYVAWEEGDRREGNTTQVLSKGLQNSEFGHMTAKEFSGSKDPGSQNQLSQFISKPSGYVLCREAAVNCLFKFTVSEWFWFGFYIIIFRSSSLEDGAVPRMIKVFSSCNSAPKLLYAVGVNLGAVTGFTASCSV